MRTRITKLLGIEYPIIQGGMAWVAEYHLAAGFKCQWTWTDRNSKCTGRVKSKNRSVEEPKLTR